MVIVSIVLALVGLGAGFGASTYVYQRRQGALDAAAKKEKDLFPIIAQCSSMQQMAQIFILREQSISRF